MIKLNMGCGNNYKEGWINVDFNKGVKADIYSDLTDKLPFKDNYADEVLLDSIIEHIRPDCYFGFLEELHRICKQGAKIMISTGHYSGMYALKHLTHYLHFGVGSFDMMTPEGVLTGERYTKARFKIIKEELRFFHHDLYNFKFFSNLPINWLFNFNRTWQLVMERFQFFGFDEIYYELEVVKEDSE